MKMIVILILTLFLVGCFNKKPQSAIEAKVAVETPCTVTVPQRPVFPADNLTGEEDIFMIGMAMWADRKARQAYDTQLEIALKGCTK